MDCDLGTAPAHYTPAAPWGRLRAWIDKHEAWERANGQTAPLSARELAGVSSLVPLVREPQVGNENYVSNLMTYVQQRRLIMPTFADEGPVDVVVNGLVEPRWRCFCSLGFIEGRFPREGHGWAAGDSAPAFKSKKVAKQFAAKMALEYISLKMEPEPATESPPVAPPAATYPQKKQKLQQGLPQDKAPPPQPPLQPPLQQQPQQQPQQQTTPAIEGMPVPPASTATPPVTATSPLPLPTIPPPAPMPDAIESSSGELSNNVTQLGNKLGLGMPMYRFVEIPGYPNFYRCWIEFEPFPERYGEVDGVLGKTEAKMQVAEKTAEQLQEQLRGRQSMMEDILAAAIAPP